MLRSLSNLHHAYLLVGDSAIAEKSLHKLFADEGETLIGSADFFVYKEPTFGIDEARKVAESAILRAFGIRKVFLIAPEKITLEAQNALLKTFEDPIADTHFFLVVRDEHLIIPTLRSRMNTIHVQHLVSHRMAEEFVKISLKDRLTFVKKFVDQERNLSVFLDELLGYLRREKGALEKVEKVYKARLMSDDRSVSSRLILEHLSLVL